MQTGALSDLRRPCDRRDERSLYGPFSGADAGKVLLFRGDGEYPGALSFGEADQPFSDMNAHRLKFLTKNFKKGRNIINFAVK
jgi:hypothetical protein